MQGQVDLAVNSLTGLSTTIVLQWIPERCGIAGNERADRLAKRDPLSPSLTPNYKLVGLITKQVHLQRIHPTQGSLIIILR